MFLLIFSKLSKYHQGDKMVIIYKIDILRPVNKENRNRHEIFFNQSKSASEIDPCLVMSAQLDKISKQRVNFICHLRNCHHLIPLTPRSLCSLKALPANLVDAFINMTLQKCRPLCLRVETHCCKF